MTNSAFSLRDADSSDVATIIAFIRELAEYEKLAHEMVATEDSIRHSLFGDNPAAEVVIAEVDETPAGFALYFRSYSTFLGRPGIYLEDLFVRRAHRGIGIGKALLRHVAGIACARDYGRLEWAVLDWNEPAIGLYEQMGARAMGDWTTYRVSGDSLLAMAQSRD